MACGVSGAPVHKLVTWINKMTDIATEIKEARSRIADFERQRVKIAARSNSLRTQLGKIKRRLHQAPEQTHVEFEEYYRKKLSIIEELSQCEKTATAIKAEQQRWRMIADSVERHALDEMRQKGNIFGVATDSPVRQEIEYLCNKYLNFAEDQTRVNSMRIMAAQFANELTDILKINCFTDAQQA